VEKQAPQDFPAVTFRYCPDSLVLSSCKQLIGFDAASSGGFPSIDGVARPPAIVARPANAQNYMVSTYRLNGRMQKRLTIAVVVRLAELEDRVSRAPELTYTENISAHGACVVSSRAWRPGEAAQVTSVKERIALRAKVVHCEKRPDERYAVGFVFPEQEVTWAAYRNYA
jgi:hypothetical protein